MFRQWLAGERKKLRNLSAPEIAAYIWEYYKLWIIGFLSAVIVLSYLIAHYANTRGENWFYVCFGNVPLTAQLDDSGPLHREFAEYAGYDLKEKNLIFDANCFCKPSEHPYSNRYYDKLIALIDSGALDALVMEEEELKALGASGRLLDLQGELFTVDSSWSGRLVYCENTVDENYGKDWIPIAIDLSGSVLAGENRPYPDGCAVGLSSHAAHADQLEVFLSFLFEEEK